MNNRFNYSTSVHQTMQHANSMTYFMSLRVITCILCTISYNVIMVTNLKTNWSIKLRFHQWNSFNKTSME